MPCTKYITPLQTFTLDQIEVIQKTFLRHRIAGQTDAADENIRGLQNGC